MRCSRPRAEHQVTYSLPPSAPHVGQEFKETKLRRENNTSWGCMETSILLLTCIFFYSINYIFHIFQVIYLVTEKAMAPHSSTLAWKIPWVEEPGGLQSLGSLRVRNDRATSLSLFSFMHWRRKWQPTPVFLPGESQGRGNLVGCRLWGRTESDTTDGT